MALPIIPGARGPQPRVDWLAVETDYRAGLLTFEEMSAVHGCAASRICKVAKERSWSRDLSAKIRARAESALNLAALTSTMLETVNTVNADANETVNADAARSQLEVQVIEVNAAVIVQIKTRHRTQLAAWQKIIDEMRVEMATEDLTFMQRAQCIKTLTDALRNLINSERVAYNLDAIPDAKPPEPVVDPMELARDIAFALARGLH